MKRVAGQNYLFVSLGHLAELGELAEIVAAWYEAGAQPPVLVIQGSDPDTSVPVMVVEKSRNGVTMLLQVDSTVGFRDSASLCEEPAPPNVSSNDVEAVIHECCEAGTCEPVFHDGLRVAVYVMISVPHRDAVSRERIATHIMKAVRRGVEAANGKLCCLAAALARRAEIEEYVAP